MIRLSLVVPVYDEPFENIRELYERVKKVCTVREYDFEILFIDDGSSAELLGRICDLRLNDFRVKIISFDRNYGTFSALWAGFQYFRGDILFIIDADLQYFPEDIPLFVEKIRQGYEIVGGVRPRRGLLSRVLTVFFNLFSAVSVRDQGCPFNAMKREIVEKIVRGGFTLQIKPRAVALAGKKTEVEIRFTGRRRGTSHYPLFKYIVFGLKYVLNYSRIKKNPYRIKALFLEEGE